MAEPYSVKKVTEGPNAGQWGVYKGRVLMMTFKNKRAATQDKNRRNDDAAK